MPSFLDEAFDRYFEGQRRVMPQHTNRVSQAGIECARQLQWRRTKWSEALLPSSELQRRFELGNRFEPIILQILQEAGVTIRQSQRDLEWKHYQLTGHIDGTAVSPGGEVPVFDVKTAARFTFEKIRRSSSARELLQNDKSYIRGYVVQAALYALLLGLQKALLFFVDKESFRSHTIEISLDDTEVLEAAEQALQRFERVNQAIAAGEDLPPDPGTHCGDCPFRHVCLTDRSFGDGMALIESEEVAEMVARHEELRAAHAEYERLDEELKATFNRAGVFLVGDYEVIAKETTRTVYEIPEDVKKQYAAKKPQIRRTYKLLAAKSEEESQRGAA